MSPLVHAWSASKVVWQFYFPSSEHYNWQPGTCIDLTTAARSTIRGEIQLARIRLAWPDPTGRQDTLSHVPTPSGIFVGHSQLTFQASFPQVTKCWGKNVQGKGVGDTPHKSSYSTTVLCINRVRYAWLHSLAYLCDLLVSK